MTTTANIVTIQTSQSNTVKALYSQISRLSKAEAITKTVLGELSRSILQYHLDGGHDVGVVNRLLSVLSPVNTRASRLFFSHHLPYTFDAETNTFGRLIKKDTVRTAKYECMESFLKDETNTIWTWQRDNINMEKKPVDYVAKVGSAVASAIKHEADKVAIVKAVMAGGLGLDDIIAILNNMDELEVVAIEPIEADIAEQIVALEAHIEASKVA